MEIDLTCSSSQYLSCLTLKYIFKIILTSIWKTKKHDFCHFLFARIFWLVEKNENLQIWSTAKRRKNFREMLYFNKQMEPSQYPLYCCYRGYSLGPMTFWEDSISRSRQSIHTGTVSTCTWCPYLPWRTWNFLILIIFTSKRTSAQSESPTPFLGFWVPTKTIHAISPWFRGIAQQPRDHSEAHC
jgi:hypothetical protein